MAHKHVLGWGWEVSVGRGRLSWLLVDAGHSLLKVATFPKKVVLNYVRELPEQKPPRQPANSILRCSCCISLAMREFPGRLYAAQNNRQACFKFLPWVPVLTSPRWLLPGIVSQKSPLSSIVAFGMCHSRGTKTRKASAHLKLGPHSLIKNTRKCGTKPHSK